MPALNGKNIIGGETSALGTHTFHARNPATGEQLEPAFHEAATAEIDQAAIAARGCFDHFRTLPHEKRAEFLEAIADEIMALGDSLLQRAEQESGLPQPRLIGERGRTVNQLKLFAQVVRDGEWQGISYDEAIPDREPLPKPELKRIHIPLGPVAIFGASNFPLAFSVAGGDTASALAAGCPVIVKGHPAHPGTSEMTAQAVDSAIKKTGLPSGIFSLVQGTSHEVGAALVTHPAIKAVGFTGSIPGGRSLFDLAAQRPAPIPVFAEMGSTNPMFLSPATLAGDRATLIGGLTASITLGVGQFCTKPGLIFVIKNADSDKLIDELKTSLGEVGEAVMLHAGIKSGYDKRLQEARAATALEEIVSGNNADDSTRSGPVLLKVSAEEFLTQPCLHEEIFGPASIVVECEAMTQWNAIAEQLHGQLTASLHATNEECSELLELVHILERKAGRLIFNGYPTGVEVCASMTHGGPYPACTDSRSTSVGTASINRFLRPVSYQDFPESLLPPSLRTE